MFFDTDTELIRLIKNSDTSIVVKDLSEDFIKDNFKNVFFVRPGEKKNTSGKQINSITIDQIREVIDLTTTKQLEDQFIFFEKAEKLQIGAENAALKLFEEPGDKFHFILLTDSPASLLSTIRSRAAIYIPRVEKHLEQPPMASEEIKNYARRLLVAKPDEIIAISDELSKKKDTASLSKRDFTLKILETTIEMAEKSYFKTKNEAFTSKINGLILAYEAIKNNCNLRLQLVANLV